MKKFILSLFFGVPLFLSAQYLIIDSKGRLIDTLVPNKFSIDDTIAFEQSNLPKWDSTTRQALIDTLLSKVQRAINNIKDDSLYVGLLYKKLWGSEYAQILKELESFAFFLKNDSIPPKTTFNYIPDLHDFRSAVLAKQGSPFHVEPYEKKTNSKLRLFIRILFNIGFSTGIIK